MTPTRRQFLRSLAGTASLGVVDAANFGRFSASRADGAESAGAVPEKVRFGSDIEPIVRLLEETPRARCIPALIEQLRQGLPYERFLAAVFLAAVRKQNSGHDVYKMHSVHWTCSRLPPAERLLPLFWAVDVFKRRQEEFPCPPLPKLTGPIPAAEKASAEFVDALRRQDLDAAEHALVALVRDDRAREIVELLWSYGCRNGGLGAHGAIVVSNCFRALETIGWREAEPVLRFVVRDMYNLYGRRPVDASFAPNSARVEQYAAKLPGGWTDGKADAVVTLETFELLRAGKPEEACDLATRQLLAGVGARAVWDAVHLAAAELMVRHNDGWGVASRPLHGNTSLNAMHYAFGRVQTERARLLVLLQAIAWTGEKTRAELALGTLRDIQLVQLPTATLPATAPEAVDEIFSLLPPRTYYWDAAAQKAVITYGNRADADDACRKVFQLCRNYPEAASLYSQQARSRLCRKTNSDTHDYKFQAAILEDADLVSPAWRPHLLAASVHFFHGKQGPDYPAIAQAEEALRTL